MPARWQVSDSGQQSGRSRHHPERSRFSGEARDLLSAQQPTLVGHRRTEKRFSEPEIVDVQLLTGLTTLNDRLTDPLGLEPEFPEETI